MALVPVPSHRLLLVDAPALSSVPRLLLVQAGVPLPAGVRPVATVSRRLGSVIMRAQSSPITSGPACFTSVLGLGGSSRAGHVLSLATRGSALLASGLGLGDSTATPAYGSSFTTKALPAGAVGYTGHADEEAKRHTAQVTDILRIRARLEAMFEEVPVGLRSDVRAVIADLNKLDPVAPVHHWVVPRLKKRLRVILGQEVYEWILEVHANLDEITYVQKFLLNMASSTASWIKSLSAQVLYTVMHTDEKKAALPFDHLLYDISPRFLKTLADIECMFYENIDVLCLTKNPPVTLQQLSANHAHGLFLTFEAIVEFRDVVNPALPNEKRMLVKDKKCDPVLLMKELKRDYKKLVSEELKMKEYLQLGSCEKHTTTVWDALGKLNEDLKPLRLRH